MEIVRHRKMLNGGAPVATSRTPDTRLQADVIAARG
jgi:hypothetical protein